MSQRLMSIMSRLLSLLKDRGIDDPDVKPEIPQAVATHSSNLLKDLQKQLQHADDVNYHSIKVGKKRIPCVVVFIEGMVDTNRLELFLLKPLLTWNNDGPLTLETISETIIPSGEIAFIDDFEIAMSSLLEGDTLIFLEGDPGALHIQNRGPQSRGVEDPVLEVTVRGPRDSFTETLFWNTALIRRRLRDPSLSIKFKKVGRRSRTDVALVYIDGIAPKGLVKEIEARVEAIDIDGILDTGYIEQLIEDSWLSPFPQHLKTERPDKVIAGLLIGRVALLADTTPFVLIMPATFDAFFHSPEDSYDRYFQTTILRTIRFLAASFSTLVPSLYVALVAYHSGILPTEFALKIQASREGVAFPVLIEAMFMQFFLELIKEAGIRLPGPLGQTFGIVGGLILGDVGIRAGIVSEAMVITVAATAIMSFASVDREVGTVLRLLGFPVMISTAVLGLYGLIMAILAILIHLSILRSYGVPYMAPYPYYDWTALKDSITTWPLRTFRQRPKYLTEKHIVRQRHLRTNTKEEKHYEEEMEKRRKNR